MKQFWFALGCWPLLALFLLPTMMNSEPKETVTLDALAALTLAAGGSAAIWFALWCWA